MNELPYGMKNEPTLTPFQAMERFKANNYQTFDHEGWTYVCDGPMMSPKEMWGPSAYQTGDEMQDSFFAEGMPGDEILEDTKWVI